VTVAKTLPNAPAKARGARKRPGRRAVAEEPLTAYELVTRRAVEDLERELARIDGKVNALMVGMVATLAAEVWRALLR
jgi:hypothetical protein